MADRLDQLAHLRGVCFPLTLKRSQQRAFGGEHLAAPLRAALHLAPRLSALRPVAVVGVGRLDANVALAEDRFELVLLLGVSASVVRLNI
jgi:hypothetical protein